jgi:hypothetical protein
VWVREVVASNIDGFGSILQQVVVSIKPDI